MSGITIQQYQPHDMIFVDGIERKKRLQIKKEEVLKKNLKNQPQVDPKMPDRHPDIAAILFKQGVTPLFQCAKVKYLC